MKELFSMTNLPIYYNFEKALTKLEEFVSTPITEDRDRSGIIQAFEFSFELAWKSLQKALIAQGFEIRSPKHAIEVGFRTTFLKVADEDIWKDMLKDRNLTVHTYKEELAVSVVNNIKDKYLDVLKSLLAELKK